MKKKRRKIRSTPGERIIHALKEAIAIERGEMATASVHQHTITARAAVAEPARQYSANEVRDIRSRLELSQSVFAQVMNVRPETVRAWEQGKNPPSGPAARLLEVASRHPEWLLQSIVVR